MTHHEPRSGDAPVDPAARFDELGDALTHLQVSLDQLLAESARGPLVDDALREQVAAVRERRDAMLRQWGLLALSVRMAGGSVRLDLAAPAAGPSEGGSEGRAPQPVAVPTTPAIEVIRRVPPPPRKVPTEDTARLIPILGTLGRPPAEITHTEALWDELYRLADALAPAQLSTWPALPKTWQKALVGMVVARARMVQDETPEHAKGGADLAADLDRIFSAMTAHSKREQPGFVFGLQRHHHPVAETWAADATRWWEELCANLPDPDLFEPERALERVKAAAEAGDATALLEQALAVLDAGVPADDPRLIDVMRPHREALKSNTRFKRLRKAIRDADEGDAEAAAETSAAASSATKALPSKLFEKRTAFVVGALPEAIRERIRTTLPFESIDWVTGEGGDVEGLPRLVRGGSVDLVVSLRRYVPAQADKPGRDAAAAAGVPWVVVEGGSSVRAIAAVLTSVT